MKSSNTPLGADDLIPVLVRVLTLAKPNHLISDLRFVQRFHNPDQLKGQAAYSFTNIVFILDPNNRNVFCLASGR
jgi:hypothetical protein